MKFLLPLLFMQFLCVKCFPWDDCDGADLICDQLLPVRPELNEVVAYEDGEAVTYGFEDSNTTHNILAFRTEFEAGTSQRCQDEINAGFSIQGGEEAGFSLSLSTDVFNRNVLHFSFTFVDAFGPSNTETFEVIFDESGTGGVLSPFSSRTISDTLLVGNTYEDVLLVEIPTAEEAGQVSAFYYSKTDGLLRVERIDQAAFIRID
ncbi:hypothetical protein FUA23_21495 [Neolewinella aurantiaca]|uniref:Uncharacterized protein n=1 Tax=Neolewinella aurantiaca TaxID=2602767 RepID=A0A5C7FEJ5_9BACT|nr:hypothetical protein [Neolewinella aurantiaca]TXF83699.1 hypothetical protein FUA23_21495 [Neolewinella aurantiaca]